MAKRNVKNEGDERLESIETSLTRAEQFVINNRKAIVVVLVLLALAIGAYFVAQKKYFEPREQEAQTAIYHAEQYFANDDFAKALNGDGNYLGFADVIDEFSGTEVANLAKYYAGLCCLNTGDFNQAVSYLEDYNGKDVFVSSVAIGALADAYMELDNLTEAVKCYEEAATESANSFTSPMYLLRAGIVYEMLGNYAKAIEMYNVIKADYPNSPEGFSIEKNIARAQSEMK